MVGICRGGNNDHRYYDYHNMVQADCIQYELITHRRATPIDRFTLDIVGCIHDFHGQSHDTVSFRYMLHTCDNRQSLLWKMQPSIGRRSIRNEVDRNGESVSWSWRSQLIVILMVIIHYDHDLTHHAQWEKHCLWQSQLGYQLDNSRRLMYILLLFAMRWIKNSRRLLF